MKFNRFFSAALFFIVICSSSYGQNKGLYKDASTASNVSSNNPSINASLNLPVITAFDKKVKAGKVIIYSNFGGNYSFGKKGYGSDFKLKVDFKYSAFAGSNEIFTKDYSVLIDNDNPEFSISRDLKDRISIIASQTGFDIDRLQISHFVVTDQMEAPALSYNPAKSNLKVSISYEIEYGIDVRMKGSEITLITPTSSGKAANFNWGTTYHYPNYQFQLLRLYNNDPAKKFTEGNIRAEIDWSKAVTIETEKDLKQLSLTISEGTGFYVWRVRPIGNYFDGGVGNNKNYGDWNSSSPLTGTTVNLPSSGPHFFFFHDADDPKNYIYSRTFTEENKIKESITYANGLLQEKQTQVHIPSDNTTITSQTIQDNLGRPALKTLPTPVSGKLQGYKNNFVTTDGHLYGENDFDGNETESNPKPIDSNTSAGSYYSGNNNVPSAEGYPYSRVLFYEDGTGRVKEQSGVGKKHMIGNEDGKGKTVKTFYGTPSKDELLALFGSEAPNHESIQKIITVDQNNIASISYQGKDGHVIATALTFIDDPNSKLLPLSNPSEINVSDKLVGGVKTSEGYVSSKRIVFTEPSTIAPEYMIECKKFEMACADVNANCHYTVKVIIHNIDNPAADIVLSYQITREDLNDCKIVTSCDSKTGEYFLVTSGKWVKPSGVSMPISLPAGTYVIEKKLIPGEKIEITLDNQEAKIEAQIGPLKNWIIGRMEAVQCPEELHQFYNDLLARAIAGNEPNGVTLKVYGASGILNTHPFQEGNPPLFAVISSECCPFIKINLNYTPRFKCPPTENMLTSPVKNKFPTDEDHEGDDNKADVNFKYLTNPEYTEYFPDFEGYAISMLLECDRERSVQEAKHIFYSYMIGWKEGEFNQMVHHMLTDKYSCDGSGENAPEETSNPEPSELDPCTPANESMIPQTQYRCADLAACWNGIVMMLVDAYCPDPNMAIDDMQGGGSVSNGVDEQNGGSSKPHDDHFDEGMKSMPGLMKWLAKQKLSKKMRDMQTPGVGLPEQEQIRYVFHGVDMFLKCTGYKFADILQPAPECNSNSPGVVGEFRIPQDFGPGKYNSCKYKSPDYGPISFEDLPVETDADLNVIHDGKKIKHLFPNIKNPIYAFKYFEYADDTYPILEAMTCYKDPNDCYDSNGKKVPCCMQNNANPFVFCKEIPDQEKKNYDANCNGSYEDPVDKKYNVRNFCSIGEINCPYTKEDWSCSQRQYFFELLKAYREYNPFEPDEDMTCSWMSQQKKWYKVPPQYENETGLEYVDAAQFENITGLPPQVLNVQPSKIPGLKATSDNSKTDYLQTQEKEDISFVEMMATKKKSQCINRCEERRPEFRKAVMDMFTNRCYVFEGCKRSEFDNIVNKEDIELIVDELVKQCQTQCPLTTYSCVTTQCRLVSTKKNELGPNSNFSDLELGVGGRPGDCPAGIGAMQLCCSYGTNGIPQHPIDGVECQSIYSPFSYYEYTAHKQAEHWFIELDIVSMCNENMQYVDADNDGRRDDYPLYYYKMVNGNKVKTAQVVDGNGNVVCDPRPPATTHVPRDAYEVKTNTPPDITRPLETVVSPSIGITVEGH
ncbi:MAG: hypothetical protein ACK40G_01090 [Cytophagaceae bacterium]